MKTLFLKSRMPIATAILAIAGAFATTSMQSVSSSYQLKLGYAIQPNGVCDIAVQCTDVPSDKICRVSYPLGQQAFNIDPILGTCVQTLWRP